MAQMKVRYKGASDVRELPAKDLAKHDVNVDKDLVFDASNGWSLTMDVSEKLEKLLRDDGAFTLSAVKDDGGTDDQEPIDAPLVEDDTADTVVMADTGQIDKKK